MGDNFFPRIIRGILVSLAGAVTCAGRPGTLPAPGERGRPCPRHFWEPRRDSAHRGAPSPQEVGAGGCLCRGAGLRPWRGSRAGLLWEVVAGVKRQSPAFLEVCEPGVSRETRRLLLMQHNSPSSLPFSHNKHTAKSLASCFDEATCISPFSVYRKLLLKKVILVFTARVKGPGRLPSGPAGLRAAQEGPERCEGQR